ncbi:MAG TPA: hypothetical protein VFF29_04055 [Bacteroidota bacterium]|nr:hypothetical protein [Bacteroidota bacterium]
MRNRYILFAFVIMLIGLDPAYAQRRRPPGPDFEPGPERIERFKTMRLVEALKLKEEESVRFFAKQNTHDEKVRELMKSRNETLDEISENVREQSQSDEIQKRIDTILEIDQNIFQERKRYHEEMRKFLSQEQFAKFLLFEREFEQQVRDAMREMRRRPPLRPLD